MDDSELERLREQLAERDAFVRRLAHDMGAPLRTIQGFTEVLMITARNELSGKSLAQLERLGEAATRLDAMVKGLGQYARVGPAELPREPTDLGALVRESWAMLQVDVDRMQAQLEVSELPSVPVAAPPLRSILLSLLDNALRYSEPPAKVRVEAEPEGEMLRISVLDQGRGIASDQVEWVLAPACVGAGERGAGMGLAIARAQARALGGELGLSPNTPRGTRAFFTVPRNPSPPDRD